jgi:hemerythrin-like domain-containing protein
MPASRPRRSSSRAAAGARKSKKGPKAKKTRKTTRRPSGRKPAAARTRARGAARTKPQSPSRLGSVATAVRGTVAGAVSAVAGRLPGASKTPDALRLLEQDHRRLEALLKEGEETTERATMRRAELLRTLATEISMHEHLEETLLYPALEAHPEAAEIVREGYEEHHIADVVMRELDALATDHSQWGAKFKVLKENIEHHIEEEEGEMFRTARAVMSREELQQLGETMARMKRDDRR